MPSRFLPIEPLHKDAFVESWRATDERSGEPVVIRRTLLMGDPVRNDRIAHLFRAESQVFARRNYPGFPTILEYGIEGSAWVVRPWIADHEDDPERLLVEGAEALSTLHGSGIWHLNLHRGNAIRGTLGLFLTDPGMARDWVRDSGVDLSDPNPAPEQRTPEGRRGAWTDVWRLAATAKALGHRETDVLRRALQEDPVQRYPDAAALLDALVGEKGAPAHFALGVLDEQLVRLNQFSYERRACPACGGVLVEPKPLPKGHCPVCRQGRIMRRSLDIRMCPVCHGGILKPVKSADPPAACPRCTRGRLKARRGKATCHECGLVLTKEGGKWSDGERSLTAAEWREAAGRTETVLLCDGCDAQFDLLPDGRREKKVGSSQVPETLTEIESSRLAGFAPFDGGNGVCSLCLAEYAVEPDAVTLLLFYDDPFGFGAANRNRRLPTRFMAKEAMGIGDPGVRTVCDLCDLRLGAPWEGKVELRAVDHPELDDCLGESRTLEDWHRVAQSLPLEADRSAFDVMVERAMRRAYRAGELGFDFTTSVFWRGNGTLEGRKVAVMVTDERIEFRRGIRRTRIGLEAFRGCRSVENRLIVHRQEGADLEIVLAPQELPVNLQSGRRTVHLEAKDLAARLGLELCRHRMGIASEPQEVPKPEDEPAAGRI